MKNKTKDFTVKEFIERFPELELPVSFTDENVSEFSRSNSPLAAGMIEKYIIPCEQEIDEFTEFVPCMRIPETYDFYALVYWKGGLMNYQYIMLTITKDGDPIERKVLSGTYFDGKVLTKSVAHLDEDWSIHVVGGQSEDSLYTAANSRSKVLELLPDGTFSKEL